MLLLINGVVNVFMFCYMHSLFQLWLIINYEWCNVYCLHIWDGMNWDISVKWLVVDWMKEVIAGRDRIFLVATTSRPA